MRRPPVAILMVGLQGSGKTTTTAKIAKRLTERDKRRVLMASLDTRRPAAQEQLAVLGQQVGVDTLPIVAGQSAVQIARRAMEAARLGGYDVVMLDTAGRVTVDEALMLEAADVKAATNPHEVLLVADALTGQDAVNTARAFDERLGVTGIVLTRMDGDARGGARSSMRAVTGKPIKLVGTGEKVDALEEFHPVARRQPHPRHGRYRVAGREGGGELSTRRRRSAWPTRCARASSTSKTCATSSPRWKRSAASAGMLGMLPGIGKMKAQLENANIDDRVIKRQRAIIDSMTPKERRNPDILKASRKKRIAAGSGAKVEEVNKLLKMHRQMADVMKMMGGGKGRGMAGALGNMFGIGKGGMGPGWAACRSRRRSRSRRCRSRWAAAARLPAGGGLPPMPAGLGGAKGRCRACPASGRKDDPACRASAASRSGQEEVSFAVHRAAVSGAYGDRCGRPMWKCSTSVTGH